MCLGDYLLHSTPVKDSRLNILVKPEISSDQEDEIEVFDTHTSSGEFCYLLNSASIATRDSL